MTATLPVDAIREAIRAGDFERAHALLEEHEAQIRAAAENGSLAETRCRESWLQLLGAQRMLIDELRGARDEAGRAIERAGRDRRAVAAYLQGE